MWKIFLIFKKKLSKPQQSEITSAYLNLRKGDRGFCRRFDVDSLPGPVESLLVAEVALHEDEVAGIDVILAAGVVDLVGAAVHVQKLENVVLSIVDVS